MRFRTEQHLRRQSEIRRVREEGRRIECRAFTLWWHRRAASSPAPSVSSENELTEALPGARVCVIASTAAVGAAVQRNRAKRRLREIFRHQQKAVPVGCDLLLIARGAVLNWPYAELEKKFTEACAQIPAPTGTISPGA